jgi:four helix bundle protein
VQFRQQYGVARFLSYAYRSVKEVVTALELCERLFPSLSRERTQALIDEGSQISRMTYNLMLKIDPRSDSKLITQNS